MKSKQLSFMLVSLLAIVLAMSLASAQTTQVLGLDNITGLDSQIKHGSSGKVKINVTYSGSQSSVNLSWSKSKVNKNGVSWDTSKLPTNLTKGQPEQGIAKLKVAKQTSPGTISAHLQVDDRNSKATKQISFNSKVPKDPSAKITAKTDVNQTSKTFEIYVTNNGNIGFDPGNQINLSSSNAKFKPSKFPLSKGAQNQQNVKVTRTTSLNFGDNSITITAKNSTGAKVGSKSFDVQKTFCSRGAQNASNIELNINEIKNEQEGEGDSENDEWYPLDNINVDVEVENNRNQDMEDVIIEMGLYEKGSNNNVANELIWHSEGNEEYDAGDIEEDEGVSHNFEFQVDPSEFNSNQDYYVTVKAYEEGEEANSCIDYDTNNYPDVKGNSKYYGKVSLNVEDDEENMVVVDENSYKQPLSATCGKQTTFSADVWNIGDKDFEKVEVILSGDKFNISRTKSIGELESGNEKQVSFSFTLPRGANKDPISNDLNIITRAYEESDDSDYYESQESFPVSLNVKGQCFVPESTIDATLDKGSVPKAGGSFTVTTTITNTGTKDTTYNVGLSGHTDWVSSYQTSQDKLTIPAGESRQVQISIDVREEVSGNQTFTIETISDGELVKSRNVQVKVQPSEKQGINLENFKLGSIVPILLVLIGAAIIAIAIVLIVRATKKDKGAKVTPGVADF
ncbi:MAG: putative S-layer protein [Candidatus Pacearchaeota archaeon]